MDSPSRARRYRLKLNQVTKAILGNKYHLIFNAKATENKTTRTAPSAEHQEGGVKYATGASSKIRGRDNINIGTWTTRTLRAAGKLQKLAHEMNRYRWNILGLCEMRWKNFGETTTEEGHKVSFSGKEDKHEHGDGFLVHKDMVNTVTR